MSLRVSLQSFNFHHRILYVLLLSLCLCPQPAALFSAFGRASRTVETWDGLIVLSRRFIKTMCGNRRKMEMRDTELINTSALVIYFPPEDFCYASVGISGCRTHFPSSVHS